MPLTTEQREAIAAIENGAAILEVIDKDLVDQKTSFEKQIKVVNKESAERRTALKELRERMAAAKLDPDKALDDQIDSLLKETRTSATAGMKPDKDFEKLMTRIEKLEGDNLTAKKEADVLRVQNRREKASSHFAPVMKDNFDKVGNILLRQALDDGIITVNDDGNPGVKIGDDFFEGDDAVNELKKKFSEYVVVDQKPGGGAKQGGAPRKVKDDKLKTRAEFNALPMDQQATFALSGGKIEG